MLHQVAAHTPGEFETMYSSTPAWDIGRPQPALTALAENGALRGRVLDAGCGTGEHALLAASLGLDATGVDSAPTAIEIARRKARERRLAVRFVLASALELASLGERFDTVIDSGLFHVFDDEGRRRYVEALRAVVPPGGRCFLLCFSDRQPGQEGPRRVSEAEIRASFAEGWSVDAVEPAIFAVNPDVVDFAPAGAQAWRVALTRT
jgi:cyclopropane fatty-acyl-phospholipid synthase-like methyltransferase